MDALKSLAKSVRKLGYREAKVTEFKVVNLVATSDIGFRISLLRFSQSKKYESSIDYNTEKFPGLIYNMKLSNEAVVNLTIYFIQLFTIRIEFYDIRLR